MPLQTKEINYYSRGATNFGVDFRGESGTWSPPVDMRALVLVIGGGGSGGASCADNVPSRTCATGGGAGGTALSLLDLSASVTYSFTAGSGGAVVSSAPASPTSGNAGTASSFSGAGIDTITANGGNGGNATYTGVQQILSATGVTGGTASGGNIFNRTGGGSGSSSCHGANNGQLQASTGGGAAQLFIDPSVEVLNSGNADVTGTSTADTASGGANSHGPSPNVVNGYGDGGANNTSASTYSLNTYHNPGFFWEFVGPDPTANNVIKGGSGLSSFGTPQLRIYGGAATANGNTNSSYISRPGGIGGGSGGCAVELGSGGTVCYSDAGGNGLVYIYPVEFKV